MAEFPKTIEGYERYDRRKENLNKLASFSDLKHDWFGHGSVSFSKDVISQATSVIKMLTVQPEVFPALDGTIQFDFTNFEDFYFEVSIGDDYYDIYIDDSNNKHYENPNQDPMLILNDIKKVMGIENS